MVNAILWVHRTGSPWRDLPEGFGPWQSAWTRFDRWARAGVWQRAGAPRAAARLPGLHGRQFDRPRPPARGGRSKALGCQAIGRSRGGPGTKLHAIVEARGLPVEVVVTPGQVSDHDPAGALIEGRAGEALIADRGYDADRVIDLIERQGSKAVIPPRKHRCTKPRAFDAALYRQRHRIEFFFNRLKQFRRVATRYEKRAANHLAMLRLAAVVLWLKV